MKNIFNSLKQAPEGDEGGGGGGTNTTQTQTTQQNTQTQSTQSEVDKEKERLLNENAELRKKTKEYESSLQQVRDEIANLKKSGAKTSGDWQKVAEQLEGEVENLKASNEKLKEGFKNTLVSSRLREEALKQGAKPDMVDLIDSMQFDEIEFNLDEEQLRFNLKGVDAAIAGLKKTRPSFFGATPPPQFNKGGPGAPSKPQGLEDAKANYLKAMKNRYKDPVAFQEATKVYQQAIFEARKAKK